MRGVAVRGVVVRGVGAGLAPAALLIGMLTGCSSDPEPEADRGKPAGGAKSAGEAAATGEAKGGTVGGAGSPCALPVSFDLAVGWKPQAVKDDPEFGLTRQGPVTLVCEIDAKPAGNIGFLRIWTGGRSGDDPRTALEAFVAEEAKDRDEVAYAGTKAGEYAATEVIYLNTNEFLDAPKKERAFALTTPKGVVVVHLGGLDNEEHEGMLPAYELAKKSVRGA